MNHHSKPDFKVNAGPDSGQKRRTGLLWFERIALGSGLVLLLTFAGFKLEQGESGDAGLAAFYQQVHAAGVLESVPADSEPATAIIADPFASSPASGHLQSRPPEFEFWSEKRISEYRQSLLQETEPPLGVLRIERLGMEVPVYNGTDDFVLNRGVGRIEGTAGIDAPGNLGIAGHRDGFFRGLKDIKAGDVLELQTIHGAMQYRVGSTVIVDPNDVSVLAPTPGRTLTLVTCYPFYFVGHAPKRFIVQATADPQIAMN
ncbi:MAG TPA: class D sortase [Xanthomonadales bacterium]|nr:class D sortase [Xanthomonadales bacterium]